MQHSIPLRVDSTYFIPLYLERKTDKCTSKQSRHQNKTHKSEQTYYSITYMHMYTLTYVRTYISDWKLEINNLSNIHIQSGDHIQHNVFKK